MATPFEKLAQSLEHLIYEWQRINFGFLKNAMLASGGNSWMIIPVKLRNEYLSALEQVSVDQDISEFAEFLVKLIRN
ncbi:MAG: hypothetical protein PHP53_20065 [Prolixibacteraceae bacterium]|nr:hypothetical protein [Prolixibacteraceae bacterium]